MKLDKGMKMEDRTKVNGWIVGVKVADKVYVYRDGEKVTVAEYDGTHLIWKESYQGGRDE